VSEPSQHESDPARDRSGESSEQQRPDLATPRASVREELSAPEPQAEMPPPVHRVVVPRWIQLVILPLALLALFALARAAKSVLLIFIVAAVIALLLNPLVTLLRRARLPRGLAVLLVYLVFFAIVSGVGVLLANPISHQVSKFQSDVPNLVDQANKTIANVQDFLNRQGINVKIQQQGQTALQTLQSKLLKGSGNLVSFTGNVLKRVATAAFQLFLVLVVSIYLLIYGERIGRLVREVLPRGDGTADDDLPLRAQRAVFAYIRGQLAFSLIMGTSVGLALWIFGLTGIFPDGGRYAVAFGAFYGVMELIPYIGAIVGALPPVLVALFQHPITAVWVILLFVILQQVEGHVVSPQVFGKALRLNPLIVIFSLLIGGELYGIIGALISLPIAAVARETIIYLKRHLVLEPWNTPTAAALAGAGSGVTSGPGPPTVAPATAPPERQLERSGEALH
jgi:predicted PurR-regulated permease PerM